MTRESKLIKIFSGGEHLRIQSEINIWLQTNNEIEIIQMLQSESRWENNWCLTITVLYKKDIKEIGETIGEVQSLEEDLYPQFENEDDT
jgi:hypothetical protein